MEVKNLLKAEVDYHRVECELVILAVQTGVIHYRVKEALNLGVYESKEILVGGVIQAHEAGDRQVAGMVTPLESKADPDIMKIILRADGDQYRVECELVIWALLPGIIHYRVKEALYLGVYESEEILVDGVIQAYEAGDRQVAGMVTPLVEAGGTG